MQAAGPSQAHRAAGCSRCGGRSCPAAAAVRGRAKAAGADEAALERQLDEEFGKASQGGGGRMGGARRRLGTLAGAADRRTCRARRSPPPQLAFALRARLLGGVLGRHARAGVRQWLAKLEEPASTGGGGRGLTASRARAQRHAAARLSARPTPQAPPSTQPQSSLPPTQAPALVWRQARNAHAAALVACLARGRLDAPFDALPPARPLGQAPPWMRTLWQQKRRAVAGAGNGAEATAAAPKPGPPSPPPPPSPRPTLRDLEATLGALRERCAHLAWRAADAEARLATALRERGVADGTGVVLADAAARVHAAVAAWSVDGLLGEVDGKHKGEGGGEGEWRAARVAPSPPPPARPPQPPQPARRVPVATPPASLEELRRRVAAIAAGV